MDVVWDAGRWSRIQWQGSGIDRESVCTIIIAHPSITQSTRRADLQVFSVMERE